MKLLKFCLMILLKPSYLRLYALLYADDTVIMAESTQKLQLVLNVLEEYTVKSISKRLPYFGATELHPIWVNVNPDICEPG